MMAIFLLVLFTVLGLAGSVAYIISNKVYRNLTASGSTQAKAMGIVLFICIFAVLTGLAFFLIVTNVRLGR